MGARYKKRRRGRATRVRRDHERHLAVHGPFEGRPALVDQVVADVGRPVVDARLALRRLGEMDRGLRHLQLAVRAAARDGLDGVPVAVAGEEILVGVDPRRIEAQQLLHQAQVLDEPSPVQRRDEAQAADAVGDGDLVGRRAAAGGLQELDRAQTLVGELMLQPGLDESERRALGLQPGVEVLHERGRQRHVALANSASTWMRRLGSSPAAASMRSAQAIAMSRSSRRRAMRDATRRTFSSNPRRSMIGKAHSSPRFSGSTVW